MRLIFDRPQPVDLVGGIFSGMAGGETASAAFTKGKFSGLSVGFRYSGNPTRFWIRGVTGITSKTTSEARG